MTSNDADTITIQLRELIAVNKEQIAEMKTLAAQMQRDNADFHALMIKEFSDFKSEVKQDIKEIRQDMKELRAEVVVLQRDVEGIKHDVAALFHWDYWILTFIAAALVVPHLSEIMKNLIGAVVQGVTAVASLFRKGKNYDA